ncbi:hypothetical protein HanOQP8_Chr15g0556161 [Helianthus annuus]|nr:hypothetical protein HanOQP8_Chr15g0556161 [Helianthus annuus]
MFADRTVLLVTLQGSATYDYTSTGSTNEPRGFWGVIARKAKSIIDDDNAPPRSFDTPSTIKTETVSTSNQVEHRYESFEHSRNMDGPKLRKGLDKLTSSLNQIGGTIGNAFEVNLITNFKDFESLLMSFSWFDCMRCVLRCNYANISCFLNVIYKKKKKKKTNKQTNLPSKI